MLTLPGQKIEAIHLCLPPTEAAIVDCCRDLYAEEEIAGVMQATGFTHKRCVSESVTTYDLFKQAAETILGNCDRVSIGAIICVTFTPDCALPAISARLQADLKCSAECLTLDLHQACAGYPYGLAQATMWCQALNKRILLLDGDVQTPHLSTTDKATQPILSDGASATLIAPDANAAPWYFATYANGKGAAALEQPTAGSITMDGFGVFKFVAQEVAPFLLDCQKHWPKADGFVPHQANLYMVKSLAKKVGFTPETTWVAGARFGNPGSVSIPLTIVQQGAFTKPTTLLLAGFGAGLTAAAIQITFNPDTKVSSCDYC